VFGLLVVLCLSARVDESPQHPVLTAAAREHAVYQASVGRQGHQHWDRRMARLGREMPGYRFAEICAESWPRQANEPYEALAAEMFWCWRQSPGHWSVAGRRHNYFGGCMAKGRNGIWYACIIVAD